MDGVNEVDSAGQLTLCENALKTRRSSCDFSGLVTSSSEVTVTRFRTRKLINLNNFCSKAKWCVELPLVKK